LLYRDMTQDDAAAVLDLVKREFDTFVGPEFTDEGVAEFEQFARSFILVPSAGHSITVAEHDGRIVGVLGIRDRSHVALFFVDAEHQRAGVGRKLLDNAIESARMANAAVDALSVNSSLWAVSVYERLGFRVVNSEREQNGIRFVPMVRHL